MAFDKDKAKAEIKNLVKKYDDLFTSGKIKSYSEESTKKDLIIPLFRALGWDMENGDECTAEEKISRKRVDYGLRIDGIPKIFLECKAAREDIEKTEFAEQAINYAWHKGATWAVLCDFEGTKVFNAEWKSSNPLQNLFFALNSDQYEQSFDQLLLLSRESLEKGLIDKEAEKWGKKTKKVPVDKQLLNDLTTFRDNLNKNILKNNSSKNLTEDELDESVQRLLDRLIFIRTLEDKQLEAPILQSIVREDQHKRIYKKLNEAFRKIDDIYNSKLFTPHLCEELVIDDDVLEKIIMGLFRTSDNAVHYDFSAIDADVLGNIYEQYLGHILKKTDKRAKLTEGKTHRKEQGIYYTPTYVVDYIVKNTVGELVKNKKTDLSKIRILDPACGSGSFLMKAFDYMIRTDAKKNGEEAQQTKLDTNSESVTYGRKVEILKNNIFGVDLDAKAVEIAQLNLLLKAAEKKHRLPTLQENIRVGNSLVDDQETAGNKAFKWQDEFKTIMGDGGFDVIIGNPPYVDIKQLDPSLVKYLFKTYDTVENRMNLYSTFIDKALTLLKDGGYFGFIIPNSILYNSSYTKLRTRILKETTLKKIIRLPDNVFQDVKVETVILIFQKKKDGVKKDCEVLMYPRDAKIAIITKENSSQVVHFNQQQWGEGEKTFNISMTAESGGILKKIEEKCDSLLDLCDFSLGLTPYDKYKGHTQKQIEERAFHSTSKKNETFKPILSGANITRYGVFWDGKEYISYGEWLGAPREKRFFTSPRILVRQIVSGNPLRIYAGYTEEELYNAQIGFNIVSKTNSKATLKYILAILNSKLMNYYHKEKFLDQSKNLFQKILIVNAKKFPIKKISDDKQGHIASLVDKRITLTKKLTQLGDKLTDERQKIEKDLTHTDEEIDQYVYKIYELSKENISVIEDSMKPA